MHPKPNYCHECGQPLTQPSVECGAATNMTPLSKIRQQNRDAFDKMFPSKEETDRDYFNPWLPDMKHLLSSSESRLLEAVREKIENMKLNKDSQYSDVKQIQTIYNSALSDLLSFINEGLK